MLELLHVSLKCLQECIGQKAALEQRQIINPIKIFLTGSPLKMGFDKGARNISPLLAAIITSPKVMSRFCSGHLFLCVFGELTSPRKLGT